jgi:hypothetical protein
MGAEATCSVKFKRATVEGEARLETDVLQFRSADLRLSIPFKKISKVRARGGALRVTWPSGTAAFDLGATAASWAEKILNPPSRLRKIGAKSTWRVSAVGIDDEVFLKELEGAIALLSIGRVLKPSDAIFLGARKEAELTRLEKLKESLRPDGALWIIRPKGRPEISEAAVMRAGKAAGLVDVKVVSFSPTHTAEKFVIPRAARSAR